MADFSVSEGRFIFNYCCVCFGDGWRPQLCSAWRGCTKRKSSKISSFAMGKDRVWANGVDGGGIIQNPKSEMGQGEMQGAVL